MEKTNRTFIRQHRPEWLKVRAPGGETYSELKTLMRTRSLHTVCEEARCPNIGECWNSGTATFMILGDVCTRNCRFCVVTSGRPMPPDPMEPKNVAESIRHMKLQHAVITSVDRDDLPDGGSTHWANVINEARRLNPHTTIEVLVPDFQGNLDQLHTVLEAKPEILNHNIETVPHLYARVRPKAVYADSLALLLDAKMQGFTTKSGMMVGIGEKDEEVIESMQDLRKSIVDILTIGQYLQPTPKHLPVDRFVHPDTFEYFKKCGMEMGFMVVESGPLVRSSYHADRAAKLTKV
ncbi:MAG: Lipoyl synthase [Ignavibacteria bacterium]|nr:Lipoyl synthase [Ignavibacteria bacterium]